MAPQTRERPITSEVSTQLTTAAVFTDLHDFQQTTDASCVDNAAQDEC